jgi:GTPase SAR1 family protein
MTAAVQKKICMLGAFAVGKTSLVKRYIASVFSETYLTTHSSPHFKRPRKGR